MTDGGVFNVNQVAFYNRKSLNIFTELGFENFKGSNGQTVVEIKPLYGYEILQDESMFKIQDQENHVQDLAWKHLNNQFNELDIFKFTQYINTLCRLWSVKTPYRWR